MKRILFLFLLSTLSFFIFSYIDEYQNLIAPFFRKGGGGYTGLFDEGGNEEVARKLLLSFNQALSDVYLSGNSSKVLRLPASDEVRKVISEEVTFLAGRGRRMDMVLKRLTISEIKKLPPAAMQVTARERVGVRYLVSGGNLVATPYADTEYGVVYTLTPGPEGLIIGAFEVGPVPSSPSPAP